MRLGVTKNTLTVGMEIIVEGYQAGASRTSREASDENFVLAGGQRLFLGGSADAAAPPGGAK